MQFFDRKLHEQKPPKYFGPPQSPKNPKPLETSTTYEYTGEGGGFMDVRLHGTRPEITAYLETQYKKYAVLFKEIIAQRAEITLRFSNLDSKQAKSVFNPHQFDEVIKLDGKKTVSNKEAAYIYYQHFKEQPEKYYCTIEHCPLDTVVHIGLKNLQGDVFAAFVKIIEELYEVRNEARKLSEQEPSPSIDNPLHSFQAALKIVGVERIAQLAQKHFPVLPEGKIITLSDQALFIEELTNELSATKNRSKLGKTSEDAMARKIGKPEKWREMLRNVNTKEIANLMYEYFRVGQVPTDKNHADFIADLEKQLPRPSIQP